MHDCTLSRSAASRKCPHATRLRAFKYGLNFDLLEAEISVKGVCVGTNHVGSHTHDAGSGSSGPIFDGANQIAADSPATVGLVHDKSADLNSARILHDRRTTECMDKPDNSISCIHRNQRPRTVAVVVR